MHCQSYCELHTFFQLTFQKCNRVSRCLTSVVINLHNEFESNSKQTNVTRQIKISYLIQTMSFKKLSMMSIVQDWSSVQENFITVSSITRLNKQNNSLVDSFELLLQRQRARQSCLMAAQLVM